MARTKPMRVPEEFEIEISNISNEYSKQTGYPPNNSATMRRLADQVLPNLAVRGTKLEYAIWKKNKKK